MQPVGTQPLQELCCQEGKLAEEERVLGRKFGVETHLLLYQGEPTGISIEQQNLLPTVR